MFRDEGLEKIKNSSVENLEKEKILDFLLKFSILKSQTINQGTNGIIKRIDAENFPQALLEYFKERGIINSDNRNDLVFKIIKIYSGGRGRKEYERQSKAYEIVQNKILENDGKEYASIPKPYYYKELEIDSELKQMAKNDGMKPNQKKLEVLLMDFIDGNDLATMLYREVLKRHPDTVHLKEEEINQMSITELEKEVSSCLRFNVPGGKNSNPGENAFEAEIVFNENTKRMIDFLKRKGVKLNREIFEKLKNTIDLLHSNGFFHRDLHERNVMLSDDNIFIIDFGESISNVLPEFKEGVYNETMSDKKWIDDKNILNKYKSLADKNDPRFSKEFQEFLEEMDFVVKDEVFISKIKSYGKVAPDEVDKISSDIASEFDPFLGDLFYNVKFLAIKNFLDKLTSSEKKEALERITEKNKNTSFFLNKILRFLSAEPELNQKSAKVKKKKERN